MTSLEAQGAAVTRVLIADDEEDLREALRYQLKKRGFEVHTVGSGQEAMAFCEKHAVDVVLTDIRMPNGSGTELIDGLKSAFQDHRPAILCMSAFSDLTLEGAYQRGVCAYFSKPLDTPAIAAAIELFASERRQRLVNLKAG